MGASKSIFRTTHVPVGEDQRQHLELARELAQKMNRVTQSDFFPIPTPMISMSAVSYNMNLSDILKILRNAF
jgi:tryptophanyl-tRNA synthetase